jgi:hypothetical protein
MTNPDHDDEERDDDDGQVVNTNIAENVTGNLIQARTIHGGITIR